MATGGLRSMVTDGLRSMATGGLRSRAIGGRMSYPRRKSHSLLKELNTP